MTDVVLTAWSTAVVEEMPAEVAERLDSTTAVTASPGWSAGSFTLTTGPYVGIVKVADWVIRIRPRIPVGRLLFQMGYSTDPNLWRDDPVDSGDTADLWPAIAHSFLLQTQRAIKRGLLQGYYAVETDDVVLRGRLRAAAQVRDHLAAPIPLAIVYDAFSADILENQLLRAATVRLLAVPRMDASFSTQLRRLLTRFDGVSALAPGAPMVAPPKSRLTAHYRPALALAQMILAARSIEQHGSQFSASSFLVNMNSVFESFVTTALTESLHKLGGRAVSQDTRYSLDNDRQVALRPDLVWYPSGSLKPGAVMDAKYKAEKPAGYPNADVYQMLAYCTALGLPTGHLIYAEGNAHRHRVVNTGVTIEVHAVPLNDRPQDILRAVDLIATSLRRQSSAHAAIEA